MTGFLDEDKQLAFVKIIREYPIVLSKSQLPSVRAQKENAYQEILERVPELEDPKKVMKKISNMKTETKKVVDICKAGEKNIKLKEWQRELWELMGLDNQPVNYIPYAVSVEMENYSSEDQSEDESDLQLLNSKEISLHSVDMTTQNTPTHSLKPRSAEDVLAKYETEETVMLSNLQLQRLLIQQQLKYYDMKAKRLQVEASKKVSVAERQVDEMVSMYNEYKEPEFKRIKLKTEGNETGEHSGGGSSSGRDEFSIFGEYVASKIRKLKSHRQKTLAQFKINNSLFEIELEDQIFSQS